VTEQSFQAIVAAGKGKQIILPHEADESFQGVLSAKFVSGFYKRFGSLREMTFPHITAFFDKFHEALSTELNVQIEPLMCKTADVLKQRVYATQLDAITEEPMSSVFHVFLDTNRPLRLPPDSCSMLTYVRFRDILDPVVLGSGPGLTREQFALLEKYVGAN
jgi:hypothetical protein